ncbi:hypothetical protein [Streptomyces sp. NPDC003077]|uniref:hypothetical protein n=1 Tax=Streptomyces sp. NPDC003077 TaxID=3154443 RepID=UPI0033A4B82F
MTTSSVMFVNEGIFAVSDDAPVPMDTVRWSNGLAAPMDLGAWILTGINTGNVSIRAEVLDAPPAVDAAEWDEIVEISVRTVEGDLRVHSGYVITPDDLPVLNPHGPGWYRMRVHARGRAANPDGVGEEPLEYYLVAIWPQERTAAVVIRSSQMIEDALRRHAGVVPDQGVFRHPPRADRESSGRTGQRARLLRSMRED